MALRRKLNTSDFELTAIQERRIQADLDALEKLLANRPEPLAELTLVQHRGQRRIQVDLRVLLAPGDGHLISHQAAETPEEAVRHAVDDVRRQLERHAAAQRGEESFSVPSRRLPKRLRPHPFKGSP